MQTIVLSVDEEFDNQRLDRYLAASLEDYSRTAIRKLIDGGFVVVNGVSVKAAFKVSAEDNVAVCVPDAEKLDIEPENIPLDILYEDSDIIVVNKPKGMVVHPAFGHYTGTLVNALMYHCGDSLSGINGVTRPGIVHRIDKDTTGSIIACKNDFAHQNIAEQLKVHSIKRIYEAIVNGIIKDDEGRIEGPIGRDPSDRKKMSINKEHGRDAITNYKVLGRLTNKCTHVECRLETGRTHQIRVHMASIGHPLLGDTIYGPAKCPLPLQGQCLHARTLGIVHPRTGEYMEFEAPLPGYFTDILKKYSE